MQCDSSFCTLDLGLLTPTFCPVGGQPAEELQPPAGGPPRSAAGAGSSHRGEGRR